MATMKDLSMYVQEHLREYLPEEMQGAQIAVTDVQKNNGLPFTGVTVRFPGTNVNHSQEKRHIFRMFWEAGIMFVLPNTSFQIHKVSDSRGSYEAF